MGSEIERVDLEDAPRRLGRPSHMGGIVLDSGPDPDEPGSPIALRALVVALCIVVALVSILVVAPWASSPQTHAQTIQSLDKKAETVTGMVAVCTATSAAITLAPGDVGTPIAEELTDLSSDFLIVLAAIYLEKYLLTIFGKAAFTVLVPVACALIALSFVFERSRWRPSLRRLAAKLALFAVALLLAIPVSVGVSNLIETTYAADVEQASAFASQVAQDTQDATGDAAADDGQATTGQAATGIQATQPGDGTPLDDFVSWLTGVGSSASDAVGEAVNAVTTGASDVVNKAKNVLNGMVEALAVMIVTSCVIPILVLVFFVWLANTILGVDINVPTTGLRSKGLRSLRTGSRR